MHQRTWLSLITFPLVAGFTAPMVVPHLSPAIVGSVQTSQDPLAGVTDIQDVISLIRDNYVDPVDIDRVLSGGIQAALERANSQNSFLTQEDLSLPDPGPADTGLRVVRRGLYAQVLAVLPDSPAAKAGIISGDIIRKVDGESVGALTSWSLARKLRGQAGSSVTLLRYNVVSGEMKSLVLKRSIPSRYPISVRKEAKGTVVSLMDMDKGRAQELAALLPRFDASLPLVLDLRQCVGGYIDEAAQIAAMTGIAGPIASVQEVGKPDREIPVPVVKPASFPKVGIVIGLGTAGASEVLASSAKKSKLPTFGDRTASLGVGMTRILLRMGGAVEIVNQRWVGSGGERLDRQPVLPEQPLRGLRPDEDPIPRVLDMLDAPSQKKAGAESA
jgi:carboxyl-terminal processing protease